MSCDRLSKSEVRCQNVDTAGKYLYREHKSIVLCWTSQWHMHRYYTSTLAWDSREVSIESLSCEDIVMV